MSSSFRDLALGSLVLIYLILLGFLALGGPFPALVPLGSPTAYRNLYIHVPQSITALLAAAVATAAALMYLLKPSPRRFRLMDNAAVLAAVLSWLSFITGTVWAAESWGSAWSGDPRQLTVGVMAVLYTAYVILKRSVEDPDRLGRVAASYLVIAAASIPITLAAPVLFPALHPATGSALAELPQAIRMWYLSALLLLLAAAVLHLAGCRIPKIFALAAFTVATIFGGYVLWQNAAPLYRVYNATLLNDVVVMHTDRGVLEVPRHKVSLNPLVINGTSALTGHLVTKEGEVVTHWSVGFNLLATGAAVMFISLTRGRGRE